MGAGFFAVVAAGVLAGVLADLVGVVVGFFVAADFVARAVGLRALVDLLGADRLTVPGFAEVLMSAIMRAIIWRIAGLASMRARMTGSAIICLCSIIIWEE